jgi:hypothetical protein
MSPGKLSTFTVNGEIKLTALDDKIRTRDSPEEIFVEKYVTIAFIFALSSHDILFVVICSDFSDCIFCDWTVFPCSSVLVSDYDLRIYLTVTCSVSNNIEIEEPIE